MRLIFYRTLILFSISFFQCLHGIGQTANNNSYVLYLIGDAGEPTVGNAVYKTILADQLNENNAGKAVIFLGDNVYPRGVPEQSSLSRARAESILQKQIALAGNGQWPVYFLPGNHDWKRGGQDGWDYIKNQQEAIDSLKNNNIHFFPQGGCPGPVEISLSPATTLVILDTQWLLHPWVKPEGGESPCDAKSLTDIITQLDDILRRNAGKRVVVAAHHPVYTYGEHGGRFTLREHIFPLTDYKKNAWLPLPVLGSIYPIYRKIFGNIQDTSHPVYKEFTSAMKKLLAQYPGTIYAAGHEHNLQYSVKDDIHYIVSGAGSKHTPVKKKGYANFVHSGLGYARVKINPDATTVVEYYSDNGLLFDQILVAPAIPDNAGAAAVISSGTVLTAASKRYTVSETHEKWLGKNYRDVWSQKINAPVFDIGKERGGLKIIQRGGGQQTISLRLKDSLGHEFTLRSIEKYPAKAIPEAFRNTFAEDLVQDQISASHPYGAIAIPPLAQAAGIYHTNPKVVYVPDDLRLGIYRNDVANQLMLFEERPAGDAKDLDFFGNADKIIGFDKLLEKLMKDNDNHVDEKFVVRNRLFDMWVGDWDRHDDQWRWAEFDEKKGKLYRPIPRDRDQAFFVNEGRIPPIWSRKWILPKFEGFKDTVRWPGGLMFNGRYFDRSYLTGLSKDDFINVANDLKGLLTDDVIDKAMHQWPDEVYKLHGEEIKSKLKARRKYLTEYAETYYLFLALAVDVTGSDKDEWFEVTRKKNGDALIEIFKIKNGEKGKRIYSREFLKKETKEIRLYGFGGQDHFVFNGSSKKDIKIRVIGGSGNDELKSDKNEHDVIVYDDKGGIKIDGGRGVRDLTANDPKINNYDRLAFLYDQTAPLIYGNYNIDDGIFIGGGALIFRQGFRKKPYKNRHLLLGSFAVNTRSFNFQYDGRFNQVFGKWNLELDADIKSPNYVNNFFGLGNQSVFNQNIKNQPGIKVGSSINYYRVRFKQYDFEAKVSRTFGQAGFLKIGPAFQHTELEDPEGKSRFIKEYAAAFDNNLLEVGRSFGGVTYSWGFDKRNSLIIPTRGFVFQQTSRWMAGLSSQSANFSSHQLSLALYQSFRLPAKITFAFRATGGKTFGEYQIYQAQILDGRTEIRGFRKTRFYGDSKLVFNNEVRLKLASFKSYLFPASIGLTGFYDVGRVWYKDKNGIDPSVPDGKSQMWHRGIGGGVWFTPFSLTVLSIEVAHSEEETLGYFRMGFLF